MIKSGYDPYSNYIKYGLDRVSGVPREDYKSLINNINSMLREWTLANMDNLVRIADQAVSPLGNFLNANGSSMQRFRDLFTDGSKWTAELRENLWNATTKDKSGLSSISYPTASSLLQTPNPKTAANYGGTSSAIYRANTLVKRYSEMIDAFTKRGSVASNISIKEIRALKLKRDEVIRQLKELEEAIISKTATEEMAKALSKQLRDIVEPIVGLKVAEAVASIDDQIKVAFKQTGQKRVPYKRSIVKGLEHQPRRQSYADDMITLTSTSSETGKTTKLEFGIVVKRSSKSIDRIGFLSDTTSFGQTKWSILTNATKTLPGFINFSESNQIVLMNALRYLMVTQHNFENTKGSIPQAYLFSTAIPLLLTGTLTNQNILLFSYGNKVFLISDLARKLRDELQSSPTSRGATMGKKPAKLIPWQGTRSSKEDALRRSGEQKVAFLGASVKLF